MMASLQPPRPAQARPGPHPAPTPLRGGGNPMIGALSPVIGAMAQELATGLTPGREVLTKYGVSIKDFRRLMSMPVFVDMLKKAKAEFSAVSSTPDRVRLKAQLLTEMGLEEMWGIVQHPGEPAAARVSAYNSIKNLTGMDRPEEAQPLQRFSLKIVLPSSNGGDGEKAVIINANDPESRELAAPVYVEPDIHAP
jgi:hypothetical protein